MSRPAILPDLFSATSLPALAVGATPCALPNGPRTDLFGQAVARANPSAQPVPGVALPTNGTSGLPGSTSSASADLTLSLVSKLKQRLTTAGSTLFSLTWKQKVTPAGRLVSLLRASGRRTSDKDCGSWPTPNAGPQNDTDTRWEERRAELKAKHMNGNGFGMTLGMASSLAAWPTPRTPTGGDTQPDKVSSTGKDINGVKRTVSLNNVVLLADSGGTQNGSPAGTEKPGQLNPAHSRWLMGYPAEWDACAPTATPSSRKSRKSS